MKQYLYFFEDGNFKLSTPPNEVDLQAVKDGFLSIIDLDTKLYYNGFEWVAIEVLDYKGGN